MNRLSEIFNKYLTKYVNTRTVFAMDVIISAAASFLAALLSSIVSHSDIFDLGHALVWMLIAAASSALFILLFKTYRIIIRHTTIRQLARFACVSTAQVAVTLIIYTSVYGYSNTALFAAVSSLLLTFASLIIMRAAMVIVYDMVKERLDYRRNCQNVMIYGTSEKSVSCVSRLQTSSHYAVRGFLKLTVIVLV